MAARNTFKPLKIMTEQENVEMSAIMYFNFSQKYFEISCNINGLTRQRPHLKTVPKSEETHRYTLNVPAHANTTLNI